MRSNQRWPCRRRASAPSRPWNGRARRAAAGNPAARPRCMNVSRSRSYSEKSRTWPLCGDPTARGRTGPARASRRWRRQSRARADRAPSRNISRSIRCGPEMQTVPLRPAGGSQRAKRSDTPSGVLSVPVTTPSGTGIGGDRDELHAAAAGYAARCCQRAVIAASCDRSLPIAAGNRERLKERSTAGAFRRPCEAARSFPSSISAQANHGCA